jgi:hypothetical protein
MPGNVGTPTARFAAAAGHTYADACKPQVEMGGCFSSSAEKYESPGAQGSSTRGQSGAESHKSDRHQGHGGKSKSSSSAAATKSKLPDFALGSDFQVAHMPL